MSLAGPPKGLGFQSAKDLFFIAEKVGLEKIIIEEYRLSAHISPFSYFITEFDVFM